MSIRAMRVNARLTQKEVAKAIGVTTLTYRRKEQGKKDFKFKEILKMCELFGVELSAFENAYAG